MLDTFSFEQIEGGGIDGVAENLRRFKLRNARLISPLWHGDGCTGLSGLYAIINGIRLALADRHLFTGAEVHSLMAAGLRFMDGRLSPRQCVATGLRVNIWRRLADAMVEAASRRTGIRMRLERLYSPEPWNRQAAFEALEEEIVRMRVPLMLCRGGRYTVVSGVTDSSVLLFDSGGAFWLAKRACGVPADCDGARHVIYPASFLALAC